MEQIFLKAFISYRRQDSYVPVRGDESDFTFIYKLKSILGTAGFRDVFVDTGNIDFSEDYETKIRAAVADCDLFVAVVGRRWFEILEEKRASGDSDTLVDEIQVALDAEKVIVPLLVDGAKIPREINLPESIRPFHDRNGLRVKSEGSEEKIAAVLSRVARKITWRRQQASWWFRAYIIFAFVAWYLCGVQPNIIGFWEFRHQSWGAMAAIWSGLFIWPIFFLPLALVALCPPILSIIESVTTSIRFHDQITYLTPLIFGTLLAGLAIALELGGYETPWSIHPALPGCANATSSTDFQILSHYNEPPSPGLAQSFNGQFWLKNRCWPNIFYYLTVPLYRGTAPSEYLASRPSVVRAFKALLGNGGVTRSRVFYAYVISFSILIWLLGTGVIMSIFYVMVRIRSPDDFAVLHRPSERAYLCLMYTFVTMMIWVPFRISTDYFKYLYFCEDYPACTGIDLSLYLPDLVLAVTLLSCFAVLTIGLIVKFRRLALGLLGAFAVGLTLLLAFLIYWFRSELAGVSSTWQFSVAISIPAILAMVALGYAFDPSVVRFDYVGKSD